MEVIGMPYSHYSASQRRHFRRQKGSNPGLERCAGCISLSFWRLDIYGNTAKMEITGNVRKQDLVYLKKKTTPLILQHFFPLLFSGNN